MLRGWKSFYANCFTLRCMAFNHVMHNNDKLIQDVRRCKNMTMKSKENRWKERRLDFKSLDTVFFTSFSGIFFCDAAILHEILKEQTKNKQKNKIKFQKE